MRTNVKRSSLKNGQAKIRRVSFCEGRQALCVDKVSWKSNYACDPLRCPANLYVCTDSHVRNDGSGLLAPRGLLYVALADRRGDLIGRILINLAQVSFAAKATNLLHCREVTLRT